MSKKYCMSKEKWPILYSKLLHKMGQYFLDTQFRYHNRGFPCKKLSVKLILTKTHISVNSFRLKLCAVVKLKRSSVFEIIRNVIPCWICWSPFTQGKANTCHWRVPWSPAPSKTYRRGSLEALQLPRTAGINDPRVLPALVASGT